MASNTVSMPSPVCLIENGSDSQLHVNPLALQILDGIRQPVVAVSVVGMYRTGKSYLMNKLAGQREGFALGSTIQSHTKGIWMWCVPHPTKPDLTLVLLDTEGLGDVEKGDQKNDCWIFALAILLSSTLIYNSKGTIDNNALENLQYVTELTDLIKVKSPGKAKPGQEEEDEEEDTQYVRFFPIFVWAVRDFTLELKIDGRSVSEDQYLEHALSLKKGSNKKVSDYNLPRQCIRNFFPSRRCFVFGTPASPDDMIRLETLQESQLSSSFLATTKHFCDHVFNQSPIKTVQGGHQVTGRMLGILVSTYVETISSGSVPCLENAVVTMAQIENQAAVQEGLSLYQNGMKGALVFPVSMDEISHQHQHWETLALEAFMKRSFKDNDAQHMKVLGEKIAEHYTTLLMENEDISEKVCCALLKDLSTPMAKKLKDGFFAKPGGYELYCVDRDAIVAQYRAKPNKGVKAEEVLDQFLKEKDVESNSVLQADQKLSENEKQIAEEQERAFRMEQEKKVEEEKRRLVERMHEDEERSHQESIRQLNLKMELEVARAQEEAETAMKSKLREQELLMEKGFQERAQAMQEEIQQLQVSEQEKKKQLAQTMGKTIVEGFKAIANFKLLRKQKLAEKAEKKRLEQSGRAAEGGAYDSLPKQTNSKGKGVQSSGSPPKNNEANSEKIPKPKQGKTNPTEQTGSGVMSGKGKEDSLRPNAGKGASLNPATEKAVKQQQQEEEGSAV
ncbi:guanylate-binding protein 1 isoform X1 [Amia ocellicauda]|uniref:guanylate-binding protein 1 isoform X1 n=1 Tax=Amia ocellicauda TaxID=2972642 RepID=UPI003464A80E|nr:GBP1 protein [Amia calva]